MGPCRFIFTMNSVPLSELSIKQVGDLFAALGFSKFQTIISENEISGAMLNELTSADELLEIDSRIKPFEAKGWFKEIEKLKRRDSDNFECPVCFRLYSEVDPTTLPCGHSVCIPDAKDILMCPICSVLIGPEFQYAVNYTLRNMAPAAGSVTNSKMKSNLVPASEDGGDSVLKTTVDENASEVSDLFAEMGYFKPDLYEGYDNFTCATIDMEFLKTDLPHLDNKDSDEEDCDENQPVEDKAVCSSSKGGKKKRRKNKKKTTTLDPDEIAELFEKCAYYCNHVAYDKLVSFAISGNVYAIGYLEYHFSLNQCFNVVVPKNRVATAFEKLEQLALHNDKHALFVVACYLTRVDTNYTTLRRQFEYIKKSAELGLSLALPHLAHCYNIGSGVRRCPTNAEHFHRKAVRESQYFSLFLITAPMPEGPTKQSYLRQAADKGIVRASAMLGRTLLRDRATVQEGVQRIVAAAKLGDVFALMDVANTSNDPETKHSLWLTATKAGYPNALNCLMRQKYNMTEKDIMLERVNFSVLSPDDLKLFEIGARMNNSLCLLLHHDQLIKHKQYTAAWEACQLLQESCEDRHLAKCRLARYYEEGWYVAQDLTEASSIYSAAVTSDHPLGYMGLGRINERKGEEPHLSEALMFYQMANSRGYPAEEDIARLRKRLDTPKAECIVS